LYNATQRSRLGSNTYKRLNLSLLLSSFCNIGAAFAAMTIPDPAATSSYTAIQFYVAMVTLNGYMKGVRGLNSSPSTSQSSSLFEMLPSELGRGAKDTLQILAPGKANFPYVLGAAASALVLLHELALGSTLHRNQALTAAALASRLNNAGVGLLLFGVFTSISDACRRKAPLNSKTFVCLNAGVGGLGLSAALGQAVKAGSVKALGGRGAATVGLALLISGTSLFHVKTHWKKINSA